VDVFVRKKGAEENPRLEQELSGTKEINPRAYGVCSCCCCFVGECNNIIMRPQYIYKDTQQQIKSAMEMEITFVV